jgi:hypothetical protein
MTLKINSQQTTWNKTETELNESVNLTNQRYDILQKTVKAFTSQTNLSANSWLSGHEQVVEDW